MTTSSGNYRQCPVMPQPRSGSGVDQAEGAGKISEAVQDREKSVIFAKMLSMFDKMSAQKSSELLGTFETILNSTLPGLVPGNSSDDARPSVARQRIDQEYQVKETKILQQIHKTQVSLYEQLMACRLERFTKIERAGDGQASAHST